MEEELIRLGLTGNEAKVYSALLILGSTNAGEIIKKTRLHRNIVYDNLDKLIEKGLISFVVVKNIKHFEISGVEELKEYVIKQKAEILEREKIVNQLIPKIKEKEETERKQEATIFKGKRGLKTVLEGMTKIKSEILVFGTGWGARTVLGDYYEQWHLKLRDSKIEGRILLPESKRGMFLAPFKARYLSEEKIIPTTIAIYEDRVLNVIWSEEPLAVLIISEKAVQSYKNYFNLLWKLSKK